MLRIRNRLSLAMLAVLASGCARAASTTSDGAPTPSTTTTATTASRVWPVQSREHVDLWLHGFAMLSEDTTMVPYFRRGYRDQMIVAKNRANVTTLLDTNRDRLKARFAQNRDLAGAQFLAMYFGSWTEMRDAIDFFLQTQGNPQAATSREGAMVIALFGQTFSTPADRDWLRLFAQSLRDESDKFYHAWWTGQQRDRAGTLAAVDSAWQKLQPRIQRYLNNTQQANGHLVLSLPLDGEGRTIQASKIENIVVVEFPDRPSDANEALYVFAHEVVGAVANPAVSDNITPAERRAGVLDRLSSAGLVRGGYMLLQRVAPELAPGYANFYLRSAGKTGTGEAAFIAAFPLPELIRDAISRQLDVVLGGI